MLSPQNLSFRLHTQPLLIVDMCDCYRLPSGPINKAEIESVSVMAAVNSFRFS